MLNLRNGHTVHLKQHVSSPHKIMCIEQSNIFEHLLSRAFHIDGPCLALIRLPIERGNTELKGPIISLIVT